MKFILLTIVLLNFALASHPCGNTNCAETERCMFDAFLKNHECVKCPGNGLAIGYMNKCGISEGRKPGHPLTAIECCNNERCIQDRFWKIYFCSPEL
uniref:Uncharacterized protein n=1 Tax=Acrobeloides nanus TaxID=290746 RepID=A0A914C614_9BILA